MYEVIHDAGEAGWTFLWRIVRDKRDVAYFRDEGEARLCCTALNAAGRAVRDVRYPDDDSDNTEG